MHRKPIAGGMGLLLCLSFEELGAAAFETQDHQLRLMRGHEIFGFRALDLRLQVSDLSFGTTQRAQARRALNCPRADVETFVCSFAMLNMCSLWTLRIGFCKYVMHNLPHEQTRKSQSTVRTLVLACNLHLVNIHNVLQNPTRECSAPNPHSYVCSNYARPSAPCMPKTLVTKIQTVLNKKCGVRFEVYGFGFRT